MTKKLVAVRDVKADAFGSPMDVPTEGLAIRMFMEACGNPKGDLARYPNDYMLYEIGSYDPNSGLVESLPVPKLIMTASNAVAMLRAEAMKNQPALPMQGNPERNDVRG